MDYYLLWLLLMIASLVASVGVFFWALRSGQFSEQARAAYLPLRDMPAGEPVADPGRITREVYFLICLMGGVGICLVVTFALVILKR